ncbi:MAG TPA: hypothetical protein VN038_02385 [Dyadobacter sp.]|nr:hypothetical protein [Dyadobacter sp.]
MLTHSANRGPRAANTASRLAEISDAVILIPAAERGRSGVKSRFEVIDPVNGYL